MNYFILSLLLSVIKAETNEDTIKTPIDLLLTGSITSNTAEQPAVGFVPSWRRSDEMRESILTINRIPQQPDKTWASYMVDLPPIDVPDKFNSDFYQYWDNLSPLFANDDGHFHMVDLCIQHDEEGFHDIDAQFNVNPFLKPRVASANSFSPDNMACPRDLPKTPLITRCREACLHVIDSLYLKDMTAKKAESITIDYMTMYCMSMAKHFVYVSSMKTDFQYDYLGYSEPHKKYMTQIQMEQNGGADIKSAFNYLNANWIDPKKAEKKFLNFEIAEPKIFLDAGVNLQLSTRLRINGKGAKIYRVSIRTKMVSDFTNFCDYLEESWSDSQIMKTPIPASSISRACREGSKMNTSNEPAVKFTDDTPTKLPVWLAERSKVVKNMAARKMAKRFMYFGDEDSITRLASGALSQIGFSSLSKSNGEE